MKLFLTALLLTSTSIFPAWADEFKATSQIEAVTVFPQGADVVREAQVKLIAGEHMLVVNDLPGNIDMQSIRVEGLGGNGLEITSVDSKLVQLSPDAFAAEHKKFQDEIEILNDERSVLDQTISDADYQRKLLLSLADKQLVPASTAETMKAIDATQLGGLVDLVGVRMSGISKVIHDAQLRQRGIDRQIADLQFKQSTLAPDARAYVQVMVHVAATSAVEGRFKISYRVQEAGWVPFYDARMKVSDSTLNITRRAEVVQSTSESWDGVKLTLSTARPLGATAAPELSESEVQFYQNEKLEDKRKMSEAVPAAAPKLDGDVGSEVDAAKPLIHREAVMLMAGFNANYVIAGDVSVDNTGTVKKVQIGADDFAAKLQAITVPRLDATAYLTASFTVKGDAALLPGNVNLYRDGIYVGRGSLPMLSSGEEAKLGFGADDLIKVKRTEVKRNSGEEGILTSSDVQEMAWDISVTNLHDMTIPVTVVDRAPYSTHEDIVVEVMAGATPASIKDYEKRRGVLAWNFDLESKAEKQIKTGYKVTSPKAVHINLYE